MQVEKITSRIGARVSGVDMVRPLSEKDVAAIRAALDEHGVLFFVGQRALSGEEHLRFARSFGEIDISPYRTKASTMPEVLVIEFDKPANNGTDRWHADGTFDERPPLGSILQAHVLPAVGGDTCFASMYAAYEALSPAMQSFFETLSARHTLGGSQAPSKAPSYNLDQSVAAKAPVSHPLVTVNRAIGRKRLFVSSIYTIAIDGLSKAESDHWLAFLFDHVKSPEFQMRYRWSVGDVAFWDNHAVQHFAVPDYDTRRVMQRVTIKGGRPVGVDGRSGALQAA